MTFDQIRYVLAIARNSSFSAAADELNLATSTLSEQIRKLEGQLGVRLFDRTTRRVELTPAGVKFVAGAQAVQAATAELLESMAGHRVPDRSEVRVGAPPQALARRLPAILEQAERLHPQIKTILVETSTPDVLNRLQVADIQLGLASWPAGRPPPSLERIALWRAPTGIVLSREHPLAARKSIHLRELAGLPFVTFPEKYPAREIATEAFARADVQPRSGLQSSVTATICAAVRAEQGFTLLYAQRAEEYGLAWIPCVPRPRDLVLGLCWSATSEMNAASAAVRAQIVAGWKS